MARGKVMTDEALSINKDLLTAGIKKDFLTKDISYQDIGIIQCIANYRVKSADAMPKVREVLKEKFNASIVAVGKNQVAIVKRP
jgi:hypothetical protein